MKTVSVTHFNPSGKFYLNETIEVDYEDYNELMKVVTEQCKFTSMYMLVQDSGDNKEPYIVPHLFPPTSYWE